MQYFIITEILSSLITFEYFRKNPFQLLFIALDQGHITIQGQNFNHHSQLLFWSQKIYLKLLKGIFHKNPFQ